MVVAGAGWRPGYMLHRIGDAVTARSIHAAVLEACRLAVHLWNETTRLPGNPENHAKPDSDRT